MKKILGIAFESVDTTIVASTLSKLKSEINCECSIFAGDSYQVTYKSGEYDLQKIQKKYKIPIFTLKDFLKNKNHIKETEDETKLKIAKWVKENKIDTPTSDLFSSDHIFSHYERNPYYNRISEKEKLRVFLSLCKLTSKIFNKQKPEIVFCIGKNYLVKNIAAAICKSKKIKFFVLDHTRIENKYAFFDNFFPGKNDFKVSNRSILKAQEYVTMVTKSIKENVISGALYKGHTEKVLKTFATKNQNFLLLFYGELKSIYKCSVRFLTELKERRITTLGNSYESNPFYGLIYKYLNSVRRILYFFFWNTLH